MNKLAIVYWSGTGNTGDHGQLHRRRRQGVRCGGRHAAPGSYSAARFSEFAVVAFGCLAMGAE